MADRTLWLWVVVVLAALYGLPVLAYTRGTSVRKTTGEGIRVRITKDTIQQGTDFAIKKMSGAMRGKHLPDQSGKGHGATCYLTGMRVTSFKKPNVALSLDVGGRVGASITDLSMSIHGSWKCKVLLSHMGGSFDLILNRIAMITDVTLGTSPPGHLTLKLVDCHYSFGKVDAKVKGGWSIVRGKLAKHMKSQVPASMCASVKSAIKGQVAQDLANIPLKLPLAMGLMLDIRMMAPPVFHPYRMDLSINGGVFFQKDKPPRQPLDKPRQPTGGNMVCVAASEYPLYSAGSALYRHHFLDKTITRATLPVKDRVFLNVTCPGAICIGSMLPQLKKLGNGSVEVKVLTAAAPIFHLRPSHVGVQWTGKLMVDVLTDSGKRMPAFTAGMNADIKLTGAIRSLKLIGNITSLNSTLKITTTRIGPISDITLKLLVNGATSMVLPQINAKLGKGIPLPSPYGLRLIRPHLDIVQNSILLNTDVQLTSWPLGAPLPTYPGEAYHELLREAHHELNREAHHELNREAYHELLREAYHELLHEASHELKDDEKLYYYPHF